MPMPETMDNRQDMVVMEKLIPLMPLLKKKFSPEELQRLPYLIRGLGPFYGPVEQNGSPLLRAGRILR